MKNKLVSIGLAMLLSLVWLSAYSPANASASQKIKLNINGINRSNAEAKIINGTTYVPIRQLTSIENFTVAWNNKTKTATITNTDTKENIKLTIGNTIAYKGSTKLTLDTPPRNIDNSIYLPIRFIGTALNLHVIWDAPTKTVVIYKKTPELAADLKSSDIVKAREAVLKLPTISQNELPLKGTWREMLRTVEYYFPYGQTKCYYTQVYNIFSYYEVKNNAAWLVWEGEYDKDMNIVEITSNPSKITKEWGKRPTYTGDFSYFFDHWMSQQVTYGIIDTNGKFTTTDQIAKLDNPGKKIVTISGEKKLD